MKGRVEIGGLQCECPADRTDTGIRGSGLKGPEGMERERSRGVTAHTKRKNTRVPEIGPGLCGIVVIGVIFYATRSQIYHRGRRGGAGAYR